MNRLGQAPGTDISTRRPCPFHAAGQSYRHDGGGARRFRSVERSAVNLPAPECAHRATIMHFTASPAVAGERACEYIEDGLLVVGGGRIVACGAADSLLDDFADVPRSEHADTLIVPRSG